MKPSAAGKDEEAGSTPKSSGRRPRNSNDEIVAMADFLGDYPSVDSVQDALGGGGRDRIIAILAQRRLIKEGPASHSLISVSIAKAINAQMEAVRQDVANELKEAYEAVEEERNGFRRAAQEASRLSHELQQSIDALRTENAQLHGRLAQANEGASELKAEAVALQSRSSDQQVSIAQLTAEREDLLARLSKAEGDVESANRRIADLSESLTKSLVTEAQAKGELSGCLSLVAHLERQQDSSQPPAIRSPNEGRL